MQEVFGVPWWWEVSLYRLSSLCASWVEPGWAELALHCSTASCLFVVCGVCYYSPALRPNLVFCHRFQLITGSCSAPCKHMWPLDTDRVNPSPLVTSLVATVKFYTVKAKRKKGIQAMACLVLGSKLQSHLDWFEGATDVFLQKECCCFSVQHLEDNKPLHKTKHMTAHLDKHEESKAECSGQKRKDRVHSWNKLPLFSHRWCL